LVCSTAGDAYFEFVYFPGIAEGFHSIKGDPQALIEKFWREDERKGKNDFAALNTIGMSACYSPNENSELGFDLPFDLETGEVRPEVWQRWLAHDPVRTCGKVCGNVEIFEVALH
jgi:hypothetical protein